MRHGSDWYKREPAAYLGGVQGLTAKEHAVYAVTLDLIYAHGGAINNDPSWIAGWISDMGSAAVRKALAMLCKRGKLSIVGNHIEAMSPPEYSGPDRLPISLETRRHVTERDGKRCGYCGDEAGPFEIDHVLPVCLGGGNDFENLKISCRTCNRSKGGKTLSEWRGLQ